MAALEELGDLLWTGAEGAALARMKAQLPELRAACQPGADAHGLRVLAALGPAWWMVGLAKEGRDLAVELLAPSGEDKGGRGLGLEEGGGDVSVAVPEGEPSLDEQAILAAAERENAFRGGAFLEGIGEELLRGCAWDGAGTNAYAISSYAQAWQLHAAAYAIGSQHTGSDAAVLQSRALDGLGRVARETGRYELGWRLHVAAYDVAMAVAASRDVGLRPVPLTCAANAMSNAGVVCYRQRRCDLSRTLHAAALRVRRLSGDRRGVASSLGNLALWEPAAQALPLYRESLHHREVLGDIWGVAGSLRALAETYRKLGDDASAMSAISRAVVVFGEVSDRLGAAECLETLGLLTAAPPRAATLLGAALALRRAIGAAEDVVMHHDKALQLRDAEASAWDDGESMSLEKAVAFAGGHGEGASADADDHAVSGSLSTGEVARVDSTLAPAAEGQGLGEDDAGEPEA